MLLTLLLLACASQAPEASSPPMVELPPFQDPALEPLYHQLSAWADGRGWTSTPLARRGARLERSWARGDRGKTKGHTPNTARLSLSVFASSRPGDTYGLEWSAEITDAAGLGLDLFLVTGAQGYTPDQVRLDLRRDEDAPVQLGAPLTWTLGERVLQTGRPSGLTEVKAKLSAYQGASFAQAADRDLRSLEAIVRPALERGDYTVCDYGPSPGRGLPGPCHPRAPTAAERDAHRASFEAELARRRELLGDGAGWAALLGELAPKL